MEEPFADSRNNLLMFSAVLPISAYEELSVVQRSRASCDAFAATHNYRDGVCPRSFGEPINIAARDLE